MGNQDKLDDQLTMVDGQTPSSPNHEPDKGLDDARTMLVDPSPDAADGQPPGERFDILEELGRGGMGVVYKARDKKLGRIVALKSLRSANMASNKTIERFWREAKSIAALNHFNIINIYNVLEQGRLLWIEMEYLPGGSLKEKIQKHGPMPPKKAAKIGRQIADALDHAHSRGIFHRDIKPGNILLTERDTPKLGDFGLAQEASTAGDMTVHGAMMGTMYFASPEQTTDGSNVDARSDIYSLGATLYMLVTGETPRAIRPDRVPESLRAIICKCLEEHPDKRFQNAVELARALASGDLAVEAKKTGKACPTCGHFNPEELRFCQKCGKGLASLFRKCPKCRSDNHVDVEFCGHCGENIPVAILAAKARDIETKKSPRLAARAWKEVLEKDPNHAQARASLEKIIKDNRRIKELAALAGQAYKNGDKEGAYKYFCAILDLDPSLKEVQKRCQAIKPDLIEQRVARARTFFSVKKYEKTYNQLQGVMELDEFNEEALDLMTTLARFYKPHAPEALKTVATISMNMSGSRRVNRNLVMAICAGMLLVFFLIIFAFFGGGEAPEFFDLQAEKAAGHVAIAAKACVKARPEDPVTEKTLKSMDIDWNPAVTVIVLNPDPDNLKIVVSHPSGKKAFYVNEKNDIISQLLVEPVESPQVPPEELLKKEIVEKQ